MSSPRTLFPSAATELTGGCFCSAIRYMVTIPEPSKRPLVMDALPTPVPPFSRHTTQKVTSTAPVARLPSDNFGLSSSDRPPNGPSTVQLLPTTYPILELDHCTSCRRACGSLVQCWLVIPLSWVTFHLLPRSSDSPPQASSLHSATSEPTKPSLDAYEPFSADQVLIPDNNLKARTYIAYYTSNNTSHRPFCARCGTPFAFYWRDSSTTASTSSSSSVEVGVFDIALGTLDTACLSSLGGSEGEGEHEGWLGGIGIQRHSHWSSGIPWIREGMFRGWNRVRHPGGLPVDVIDEDEGLLSQ